MSFASYKRFEQKHEIAFDSLIKIAIALDMEKDFDSLFATPQFFTIGNFPMRKTAQNALKLKI